MVAQTGMSRRGRMRMHSYECGRNGQFLRGGAVRAASEVSIVANVQQRSDDGVIFYGSAINVNLAEGFRCIAGRSYPRLALRLGLRPNRNRIVARGPSRGRTNQTPCWEGYPNWNNIDKRPLLE